MYLNYNNLWKTLIDKGVKKGELFLLEKRKVNLSVSCSQCVKI